MGFCKADSGITLALSMGEAEKFMENYLLCTWMPEADEDTIKKGVRKLEDGFDTYVDDMPFISSRHRAAVLEHVKDLDALIHLSDDKDAKKALEQILPGNALFSLNDLYSDEYTWCGGGEMYLLSGHYNSWKREMVSDHIELEGPHYLIHAKKSVLPQDILSGRSYRSVEELVDEYKERLEDYLPADFKWEGHIGYYRFAYAD